MGSPHGTVRDFAIDGRACEIILITGLGNLMEIELSRSFFTRADVHTCILPRIIVAVLTERKIVLLRSIAGTITLRDNFSNVEVYGIKDVPIKCTV